MQAHPAQNRTADDSPQAHRRPIQSRKHSSIISMHTQPCRARACKIPYRHQSRRRAQIRRRRRYGNCRDSRRHRRRLRRQSHGEACPHSRGAAGCVAALGLSSRSKGLINSWLRQISKSINHEERHTDHHPSRAHESTFSWLPERFPRAG